MFTAAQYEEEMRVLHERLLDKNARVDELEGELLQQRQRAHWMEEQMKVQSELLHVNAAQLRSLQKRQVAEEAPQQDWPAYSCLRSVDGRRSPATRSACEGRRSRPSSHVGVGRNFQSTAGVCTGGGSVSGEAKWGARAERRPAAAGGLHDATITTMVTRSSIDRSRTPLQNTSSQSTTSK